MERIDTLNGEYLALFAGGTLTGEAVTLIRRAAARGAELIYGDALHAGPEGEEQPDFRPACSPDTLLARNYTGSPVILSDRLLRQLRPDGREDADALYALMLRALAKNGRACHIPCALFRGAPPPPCCNRRIVAEALPYFGRHGTVQEGLFIGSFDVRYGIAGSPLVSIVVVNEGDTDALRRTLESVERRSGYRRYELIVADGTLPDSRTRAYYGALEESRAAAVVRQPDEPNLARLRNEAARRAGGDLLLFLDAGLALGALDAIERLVEQCLQPGTVAAGGKIVDEQDRLLHTGLALGLAELPVSPFAGRRDGLADAAQNRYTNCTRNVSAVQGALMVRAQRFVSLGGFDETFETAGAEADLCVRLSRSGGFIVYSPYARFLATPNHAARRALTKRNSDRCTDVFRTMRVHGDPMLSQNPAFLRRVEKMGKDALFL